MARIKVIKPGDATLVVSYLNFVNRIVLALGVESDPEELRGYNF